METISGFSKLSKLEKLAWICSQLPQEKVDRFLSVKNFWSKDEKLQKRFDEFSENTLSNFYFPYGVAPNFIINGKNYCVPMVIEESSVVAAASKAANFWSKRGGFHSEVLSFLKVGHVHFFSSIGYFELQKIFTRAIDTISEKIAAFDSNMTNRGGGVHSLKLIDKSVELKDYFQIEVKFNTCDAMGANYINTILEEIAGYMREHWNFAEVTMAILSNYTPDCVVKSWASCNVKDLGENGAVFAKKFKQAIDISKVDQFRAVTHNKGIFNGIDAVVVATGNDYRAVEACGHAYASRDGQYRGLSDAKIEDDVFTFSLEIPLSLGTVGGLTRLHPLANASLDLLGNPDAKKLMQIVTTVGLAQNFAAVSSLVTTGIQKGHMKMHLLNILNQLEASRSEIERAKSYFSDKTVSFTAVRNFLSSMRMSQ